MQACSYATLDKIFGEFSEGTGSMEAYLDVQSRFPFHSARNALLIEAKCPHAERIHDEKGWKDMGVTVLEEEKRLPIIILEPGKAYRREDGSVGQNFSSFTCHHWRLGRSFWLSCFCGTEMCIRDRPSYRTFRYLLSSSGKGRAAAARPRTAVFSLIVRRAPAAGGQCRKHHPQNTVRQRG